MERQQVVPVQVETADGRGGTIRATLRAPQGASFEIHLPLGTPPTIERESAP